MGEHEATGAELSGDLGEVEQAIGSLIKDPEVVSALGNARHHVDVLGAELKKRIGDDELAENTPESEVVLRNAHGASNKFLAETDEKKLKKFPRKPRSKDPKLEDGWVTLRFRITESQRDIMEAAMKRAKELAEIEGKLWKGVALEWVCSDFLAGHGHPGEDEKGGCATGQPGSIEERIETDVEGAKAVHDAMFPTEKTGLETPWPLPIGGMCSVTKTRIGDVHLYRESEGLYLVRFVNPANGKDTTLSADDTTAAAVQVWLASKGFASVEEAEAANDGKGPSIKGGIAYWITKKTKYQLCESNPWR